MKFSRHWLWLLLLLPIGFGLARLRFDVEVLNLLPADVPAVQGLKLYQQHFANARELIITVSALDAEQTESAARQLAELLRKRTDLTASVTWQPPWLEHPDQAAELIGYLWLNQRPEAFAELNHRLAETNLPTILQTAREQLATSMSPGDIARLSYDPYGFLNLPEAAGASAPAFQQGQELFASTDGTFRLIFVQANSDLASYRAAMACINQIKSLEQTWRRENAADPNVKIHYTGGPAFTAEIAGSMESDMTNSVGLTAIIIAILFWLAHRRLVPMLWLLVLLGLILGATLAFGGLIFGTINVVSLGFAAILLGLAVDYGVVHYQEALAKPDATIPEIRRAIRPSIFWAAVTTISAFLVLNWGGLPGLAQLGSLVALGVALSALVMLFAFLPPLFRDRIKKRQEQIAKGTYLPPENTEPIPSPFPRFKMKLALALTAMLVLVTGFVLSFGLPRLDQTANALRPQKSAAFTALDEIKTRLGQKRDPLWLVTIGRDETEIASRLERATPILEQAVSNKLITSFTLPTPLWPRPDFQMANREAAAQLLTKQEKLRSTALAQGFNTNSLAVMENVFNTWRPALASTGVFWPTNEMSRWILGKLVARPNGEFIAVGLIFPVTESAVTPQSISSWANALSREGFIVSGWELLGASILQRVQQNQARVILPIIFLVLLSLWLAFRRLTEIFLSLAVLFLSGLCLLAVMCLAGWSWNLLNLMALPLMLGAGVDYTIFMQLALRRHHGDLSAAYRSVGRALLLCGGTAVAGFGSLSLSTNAGMASLGQVCAVGIGSNMLISVYLLPLWWRMTAGKETPNSKIKIQTSTPSSLYRTEFWRLGLLLARLLPPKTCAQVGRMVVNTYWKLARHRREVVVQNFLPLLNGDRRMAERMGKELFQNFAQKLVDLWRYENGLPIEHLFHELNGWEYFVQAQVQKRGVLLVTPHLGNWEFGGPMLTRRGINLHVITLIEPSRGLTELRRASRARWDIDTLVIGEDPFAVIEIIQRLEAGATVALLIDRPPSTSAVSVELFGRPFHASIAAAELARASGCVLLPVYLPRTECGYAAHMLPAIPYDRAALRERSARQQLTQEIVRAFEPAIRQYLNQWYHFVPIWPNE